MEKAEKIKLIVSLTLAKLEIQKLRSINQGYDWAHIDEECKEQLIKTIANIDDLLKELN